MEQRYALAPLITCYVNLGQLSSSPIFLFLFLIRITNMNNKIHRNFMTMDFKKHSKTLRTASDP